MLLHVHASLQRRASTRLLAVLAGLAITTGGCGTAAVNKEGTKLAGPAITLQMQTPDAPQADADFFAAEVAERTHDRIRVTIATSYPSSNPNNELRLAVALREGKVQMAYIPSRAWERDDGRVLVFRALQAPFLITSYPLLRAVTTGPIAQQMLASLSRNGLVGLGLISADLRRPLGTRPLLSASEFRGSRIRVPTSPTSELVIRALGATPVTNLTSEQVGPALAHRQLEGIESSPSDISANSYVPDARYLATNVVLFAKTETIVITRATFARLSQGDREALKAAAAATVAHADPAAQEVVAVRELCAQGLHLVTATPAQLASLERAAAPVFTALERDTSTRRAIQEIQRLKQQSPTANATLPKCHSAQTTTPAAAKPFPTGTFETVLTRPDVVANGFPAQNAHTETLTFRKNGTWLDVWLPITPVNPPGGGKYTVRGDVLTLGPPAGPDVLHWSYFRGQLTFKIISVPDSFAQYTYTAHPWRKIR